MIDRIFARGRRLDSEPSGAFITLQTCRPSGCVALNPPRSDIPRSDSCSAICAFEKDLASFGPRCFSADLLQCRGCLEFVVYCRRVPLSLAAVQRDRSADKRVFSRGCAGSLQWWLRFFLKEDCHHDPVTEKQ